MFSHRLKQKARVSGRYWQCHAMQMSHASFLVTASYFWTPGLSCDEANWEKWVFRRSDNLFLLQIPLNQLLQYSKLVTAGYFSNLIFFAFDRNNHLFILLPRFICSQNCLRSSSSRRRYLAFLPRTFLILPFCLLIFSYSAIQFLICFLSTFK